MLSLSRNCMIGNCVVTTLLALIANQAFGSDVKSEKLQTNAPTFHYSVDADFTYVDLLKRPQTSASLPSQNSPLAIMRPRTIGLTKLRLALDWSIGDATSFKFVLRPDAVSSNKPELADGTRGEFDSRAGEVYRASSTVQFLDAYEVSKVLGPGLRVGLGVYEEMAPQRLAYPEVMEFGLGVELIQKFSALSFSWRNFNHEQPTAEQKLNPVGLSTVFYAMHGNEDRGEDFVENERSYDKAPSADDPYYGAAAFLSWIPSGKIEYACLVGFLDSYDLGGKKNENFVELTMVSDFSLGKRRSKAVFDAKYAVEKWRVENQSIAPNVQQSMSVSVSTGITTDTSYFLGVQYGSSERHVSSIEKGENIEVAGTQIDTGFFGEVSDNLRLTFTMNQEIRNVTDASGNESGAFVSEDETNATLKRFAVELKYMLGESS